MFNDGSNRVCRLNKAIYGLKQAGRVWNRKLNDHLLKMGFVKSKCDPCVYVKSNIIIAVYAKSHYVLSVGFKCYKLTVCWYY